MDGDPTSDYITFQRGTSGTVLMPLSPLLESGRLDLPQSTGVVQSEIIYAMGSTVPGT